MPDCGDHMRFIHRHRGEAAVEQVAAPATPRIDEIRPPAMRRAKRPGEPGLVAREEKEMDVIGHETIGPHLDLGLAHLFGEQIQIDLLIARLEEDRLAAIAARSNAVRDASLAGCR